MSPLYARTFKINTKALTSRLSYIIKRSVKEITSRSRQHFSDSVIKNWEKNFFQLTLKYLKGALLSFLTQLTSKQASSIHEGKTRIHGLWATELFLLLALINTKTALQVMTSLLYMRWRVKVICVQKVHVSYYSNHYLRVLNTETRCRTIKHAKIFFECLRHPWNKWQARKIFYLNSNRCECEKKLKLHFKNIKQFAFSSAYTVYESHVFVSSPQGNVWTTCRVPSSGSSIILFHKRMHAF